MGLAKSHKRRATRNGQDTKKSTSGGHASDSRATDGLIAFRRYLDLDPPADKTKSAIFTMYPNGTHIRQITHPPKGFSDDSPAWSPDGTKVAFHRQLSPFACTEPDHGPRRQYRRYAPGHTPDCRNTCPSSRSFCVGD